MSPNHLSKSLGLFSLWGLGVGYVIAGMYFGWNLGLHEGGPIGLLIATVFVTIMYVCFVSSYAELSCAMPKAGGVFVYAKRGLGPYMGFLGGLAQVIEFVLAPPAIAAALGAYFTIFFPSLPALGIAIAAYLFFTALNIWGVKLSAIFEVVVTFLAVAELLIFAGVSLPYFSWEAFSTDALPNGFMGVFAAIPYAIWFYLGIEGIANVAEESKNPQKNVSRAFILAMGTLVILAMLVLFSSVGVGGWRAVVYPDNSGVASDSPLPLAIAQIVGRTHLLYHLLVSIGLFGLVASFHGIILAGGRATFELGRSHFAPVFLGAASIKHHTPMNALLFNTALGLTALLSGKTSEIIILAVFGALTLYIISLLSFFALRKKEPAMERPFVDPWYPFGPSIALILAFVSLSSLIYFNMQIFFIYLAILLLGSIYYFLVVPTHAKKHPRNTSLQPPEE